MTSAPDFTQLAAAHKGHGGLFLLFFFHFERCHLLGEFLGGHLGSLRSLRLPGLKHRLRAGHTQTSSRPEQWKHACNPAHQLLQSHWPVGSMPICYVAGSRRIAVSRGLACRQTSLPLNQLTAPAARRRHWCLSNWRRPMSNGRATSKSKFDASKRSIK